MPATRLPAFQFYPQDIQKDTGYKRCSKAERGAFLDFLCLVHECEFRGAAFDNGTAMSREEVAEAIGGDRSENLGLLAGIIAKGPIKVWSKVSSKVSSKVGLNTSRDDLCPDLPDGTLYNRRMVKDEIKRIACSSAGSQGGGNPAFQNAQTFKGDPKGGSKGTPKGRSKRKGGSSSSSSSSSSNKKDIERDSRLVLDYWLERVPDRPDQKTPTVQTLNSIQKRIASHGVHDLLTSVAKYGTAQAAKDESKPDQERYPYKGSNFFGTKAYFLEYLPTQEERESFRPKLDEVIARLAAAGEAENVR